MEIMTQACSLVVISLASFLLPSFGRWRNNVKRFQAGQGGVVRSNDGALGTKLGQLLSALYVCPFLRGLCSQTPNLLLETESIFNPNFSNSTG